MKINTYNTGATYSPMGQRVAWTVLLKEVESGSSLVAWATRWRRAAIPIE